MPDIKRKMGASLSLLNLMVALPVLLAFSGKWEFVVAILILYWVLLKKTSFLERFRQRFPTVVRIMWIVISTGLVAAALVKVMPNLRGVAAFVWVVFALVLILPVAMEISKMNSHSPRL
jgi:hypothetical protein